MFTLGVYLSVCPCMSVFKFVCVCVFETVWVHVQRGRSLICLE